MPTGLIRRSGRYSVRRVIPQDLQALYRRREIVRALGTADPREARDLHTQVWLELSQEFKAMRGKLQSGELVAIKTDASAHLTIEEAERRQAEHEAYQEVAFYASVCEEPDDDHDLIKFRVAEAVERRLGVIAEEQAQARQIAREERSRTLSGNTLLEVCQKWAVERTPSPKMIEVTEKTVRDFHHVVGLLPVTDIRKSHVITFKDSLIEKQEHPATANGRLVRLRILFRYACANAIIDTNPTDGIKVASKRLAKDARTTYDANALASVFRSPVFASDLRPKAGAGEAAYWLPLLALYTGARLNELGQLRPCDVLEEAYFGDDGQELKAWVIRIVHDEAAGLRLKTASSQRRVPIHKQLVRLGFLRYVSTAKKLNRMSLFPLLKADRFDTITANWSKWYGRYLRATCGVSDKRIVFHSFRHTFKDNARHSQIAPDVQNEITGHDSGNVADDYGGLSYPLHPLVEGMKRYRIPQFTPPLPPPAYR